MEEKNLSKLILEAKGEDISLNKFADELNISLSYLLKLINGKTEGISPNLLRSISKLSEGRVSFERIMREAEYIRESEFIVSSLSERTKFKREETYIDLARNIFEINKVKRSEKLKDREIELIIKKMIIETELYLEAKGFEEK